MRSDDEILDGVVPGTSGLPLGGQTYPVREPTNARARVIRRAMAQYQSACNGDPIDEADALENMLDTAIRAFSPEIEADWDRIAETATDAERIGAMAIIRDAVMLPFQRLANAAQPAKNRKTRRTEAKASRGRKSTTGSGSSTA